MTDPRSKIRLVTGADGETVQTDPLIGKTLSKNYTLIRLLGVGGMGKVYLAMNEGLKRRVAIKVLEAGKGGLMIARFDAEAKTAAQIESPHVVAVTDHFSDDVGNHFIVMEFVDGPDMETMLEKEGLFSLERLMPLVRQIGRGLTAAHRLGIVHRDLKGENVIVIRMDDEGEFAKIADFGIAKIVSEAMKQRLERRKLTHNDTFLGTPWYMAPEQALGKVEVDQRTDVYAFGVLVYHALTGEYPIDGSLTETYSRLVHDEDNATPITVHKPEYAHLWPVLHKAMAKKRDERYPDAKSFVDALEDAAGVPRPSRVSGMHALGHAPTLNVTGVPQAPQHDREAVTLDPAAAGQMQAPSLRTLAIGLGVLLTVAVGLAYVIASWSPQPETAPLAEEPAAVASDAEPVPVPPVPSRVEARPVVRTPRVTPRVVAAVPEPPPVPSRVETPVVRTAPPAPVAAPTMALPAACSDFLPRRRGAGRAECLQYHAVVCGNAARRTSWCDLIEATLRLPRPR